MKALLTTVSYVIANKAVTNNWTSSAFRTSGLQKVTTRNLSTTWSHHRSTDADDAIGRSTLLPQPDLKRSSGINFHLVRTLIWNQLCMLGFASAVLCSLYLLDDNTKQHLLLHGFSSWSDHVSSIQDENVFDINSSLLIGLLGSVPPILMGTAIDRSDDRRFATANFSTLYMVMALFGRRAVPPSDLMEDQTYIRPSKVARLQPHTKWSDVILWSAVISVATGMSEELIFRCILPYILTTTFHQSIYIVCVAQAILFALGHTSTKVSFQENAVVGGFQLINGLWFGGLYLFSNGDILPCIVAHAIYDFQTFLFTWSSANEQIEYAYYKSHEPLPKEEIMELRQLGSVSPIVIQDFMKVFYIFDTDKNGTISLSEARKGIAYLAIDEAVNVPPQSVIDSLFQSCLQRRSERGVWTEHELANQLRFPDFLYMLLSLKLR